MSPFSNNECVMWHVFLNVHVSMFDLKSMCVCVCVCVCTRVSLMYISVIVHVIRIYNVWGYRYNDINGHLFSSIPTVKYF